VQLVHVDAMPNAGLHGETVVLARTERELASALDRSLVLEAMGIAHEVFPTSQGEWALGVAAGDVARAEAVLELWATENEPPTTTAAKAEYGPSLVGLVVAGALVGFAAFAGSAAGASWSEPGRADAARMLAGEWWRAATALTLHADAAHVAGNAVAIGLFLTAVSHRLGPALAVWAALVAGIGGNVATAVLAGVGHVSLGASTAVFGALGVSSMLQMPERRAWITLGSGVALLGVLGAGERADVLAHLLGFAVGVVEGFVLRRVAAPQRSALQAMMALAALAPLVAAWSRALR
jgi:rhomboid protease GluP